MQDLVEWLGVQLDEDERLAMEAGGRRGGWKLATGLDDAELGDAAWLRPPYLKHVERHDPARVMREIDAKRDLLVFAKGIRDHHETFTTGVYARLEKTLRLYALAYEKRPGFQEEWRP